MQQENEITSGNAKYQCYIKNNLFSQFLLLIIKHIAIEIQSWKNVEPSTDFFGSIIGKLIVKKKNNLIDCSAYWSDSSREKTYVLRIVNCLNSYICVDRGDCHECPQYE